MVKKSEFSTCDLKDQFPKSTFQSLESFFSYGGIKKFYGQAVIISCPDDNSLVKEIVREDGSNKILVVDSPSVNHAAMLGDEIASSALVNNWSGFLINGFVRDREHLVNIEIGILARGTIASKTAKQGLGNKKEFAIFAGVIISSDSWIYVDENGFLVSHDKLKF